MNENPPHIARKFLHFFCRRDLVESVAGDLEEQFEEDLEAYGGKKANRKYIWNVFRFFRPGIIRSIQPTRKLTNYGMFKNYILTSLRFIKREKAFALMNVSGLALGIACALVIYKIITHESSFDKHHQNYSNLYRVVNEFRLSDGARYNAGQPHPLSSGLQQDFSGVKAAMSFYQKDALISIIEGDKTSQRFQEKDGVVFLEPTFFELFDFEWVAGNPTTALVNPGKVVLTRSKVKKYFDLDDKDMAKAIGKPLMLENTKTVYVSAVIENTPSQTDFPFEIIFHYQDQDATNPYFYDGKSWSEYNGSTNCFILLTEELAASELEEKLAGYLAKHQPAEMASRRELKLQPLSELHSSETIARNYNGVTVSNNILVALALVGLFLIATACVNFINLSTAQAVKRAKEIGVRKSLGSRKGQLVIQFLSETFLITSIATIAGLGLAELLFYRIEGIFGYEVHLDLLRDTGMLIFVGILIVFVSAVSGFYPALVLARLNPIMAVKNMLTSKQTSGFFSLRRALVIFQFAISQLMIIGILVINLQMDYFLNEDLGFNDDSILTFKLPEGKQEKLQVLKTNLLQNAHINAVSFSTSGPQADWKVNNPLFHPGITQEDRSGNLKMADEDYLNLYQIELIAGRNYEKGDPIDLVVVNRKLTRLFGFDDPSDALGERFKYGRGTLEFTVAGVVEDFHASSLHQELDHVVLANREWNIYEAGIKFNISSGGLSDMKELIAFVEDQWLTTFPDYVFDFEFYDERIAKQYENEQKVSSFFGIIVFIAIGIGCLGLYGLVSFMANQKTKEIGIRKVLGATELNIWNIFSKELLVLLFLAFFVAAPVAYYSMNLWLNNYAYRIDLSPWVFLVSITISLVIALATICYKSVKASKANPILSLKDE